MRAHTDELINKERFRVKTKLSVSFYWNSLLLLIHFFGINCSKILTSKMDNFPMNKFQIGMHFKILWRLE